MSNFRKSLLPARDGYYAIDFERRGKDLRSKKMIVIAWSIELGDRDQVDVQPICIDDLSDLYEGAILTPIGRVIIRSKRHWVTLEDYLSYAKGVCNEPQHS